MTKKIGFIGQGWIGKNYADDFEKRGYAVVRYALEEPYISNKDKISSCDIVFIAVPTPTTPEGFDSSYVDDVLGLVGDGKIAVIKSTVTPGSTESLQEKYKKIIVLNSPEFLSEATAAHDASHPSQNIIGISKDTNEHKKAATTVLSVLPTAPHSMVCRSIDAEMFKYIHNVNGYVQIVLFNIIYDFSQKIGCNWDSIQEAIKADPMISNTYTKPVHKGGRGAGGHCFIKDFAVFSDLYGSKMGDKLSSSLLALIAEKNKELLISSGKDLDLLKGVYGEQEINKHA